MRDARPISLGDAVVLVDAARRPLRRRGRVLRGMVLSIDDWGVALVSLPRLGEQTHWSVRYLRRCPALAYCRPVRLAPGAA
jgi:hypothetical protein